MYVCLWGKGYGWGKARSGYMGVYIVRGVYIFSCLVFYNVNVIF